MDVFSHLVYSVNKSDVDTVLIDGVIHLEDGELANIDEEAIKAEVRLIGEKLI